MYRRHHVRFGLLLGLACLIIVGCDYGAPRNNRPRGQAGTLSGPGQETIIPSSRAEKDRPVDSDMRKAIFDNVIRLVELAATSPGGDNFQIAVDNLNQYFERNVGGDAFAMTPEARAFLLPALGEKGVSDLETRTFAQRDGRHLEDCLLYHAIATRVAGQGSDLERAQALFDWTVRHVQLVPAGSLAPPGLPQAQSRPYDVLIRGQATEQDGSWAERSWVFMTLCRQVGIDVGLVGYTPPGKPAGETAAWFCAAAIDDKAYLFDARLGLPIPGPGGRGIATLEEAATDPAVLDQLDLPGQPDYPVNQADLAAGPVRILVDSSPGYLTSRMRLLQGELTGRKKVILHRDPAAQRDEFARALGSRLAEVSLWALPLEIEYNLFNNSQFVAAAQYPIQFFNAQLPLLSARLDQLRGAMEDSKLKYLRFFRVEGATLDDGKTPIPPAIRQSLDMYATYFLGLSHLEQGRDDLAELMFRQTIDLMPPPTPGCPPFQLYRWGAQANLARLAEARGDADTALDLLCADDPTPQHQGNLIRAYPLVWADPFVREPKPASAGADSTSNAAAGPTISRQ